MAEGVVEQIANHTGEGGWIHQGRSRAEFLAKMGDCLNELSETDYWLELLSAEDFGDKSDCEELLQETRELIAIFTSIIKNTKQNAP